MYVFDSIIILIAYVLHRGMSAILFKYLNCLHGGLSIKRLNSTIALLKIINYYLCPEMKTMFFL